MLSLPLEFKSDVKSEAITIIKLIIESSVDKIIIKAILLTDSSTINSLIKSRMDSKRFAIKVINSTEPHFFDNIVNIQPDLIFIRSMLACTDGLELCDRIRSHPALRLTRLIFISSNEVNREQAIDRRANKFLMLPFSKQELVRVVNPLFTELSKILLVDDSMTCRRLIRPSMEQEGYRVMEAGDGEEALEIIRKKKVDLIICDIDMPRMDGITLCRIVRQQEKLTMPVLLLSSKHTDKAIISGFNAGADDYIIKSDYSATRKIVIPELLSRVRRLLNATKGQGRPERVLLAEDSATILHTIKHALSIQGFKVDVATDGLYTWEKLNQEQYDLLIVDYEMPYVDGLELCTRIRQSSKFDELPIIIETSNYSAADQIKIRSIGIQAFITKPFSPDRLIAEVERVLAEARLSQHQRGMSHYLSDPTISRISGKNNHESIAEDKFRTILFSDIVQFTSLAESLSSRKVVDFLNLYFDQMVEQLIRHDATIDKFIGDGIFASFGLQDDGAYRAVSAAAAMLKTLPELRRITGLDIHTRIGIHSGHVILGDIGSRHHRRDFTLIGDNVNIASRLEGLSRKDGVLISHATYKMVKSKVKVLPTRPLKLKGIEKLIQAYLVTAIKPYPKEKTRLGRPFRKSFEPSYHPPAIKPESMISESLQAAKTAYSENLSSENLSSENLSSENYSLEIHSSENHKKENHNSKNYSSENRKSTAC
jgi:DNA-binding response OmpR family regulator